MLEPGHHHRFALEASDEGRIVDEVGSNDLDRHRAFECGLPSPVHHRVSSGPDDLAQPVAAQ